MKRFNNAYIRPTDCLTRPYIQPQAGRCYNALVDVEVHPGLDLLMNARALLSYLYPRTAACL